MKLSHSKLILASGSPRRAELLRAAGFEPAIMSSSVDETVHLGESPRAYAERVALAKAEEVIRRLPAQAEAIIVGADTIVVVDGQILGKPESAADARRMLRLLSGREHEVLTALVVAELPSHERWTRFAETRVHFLPLSDEEIEDYIATGEPFDKAGAYAVQGRAARFVRRIEGCYANVVGMPVSLLYEILRERAARASGKR